MKRINAICHQIASPKQKGRNDRFYAMGGLLQWHRNVSILDADGTTASFTY